MDDYTEEGRTLIGKAVEAARLERGWGKEEAGRHASISSITWKRVEDGQRVQNTKLRAIEIALHWGAGSMDRVARGRPVVVQDSDTIEEFRERGWADHDDRVIWDGFAAATQFANDCGARGANQQLVSDFIGDAVVLLSEVGRIRKHPQDSALLDSGTNVPTLVPDVSDTPLGGDAQSGDSLSEAVDTPDHEIAAHEEEGSISGEQERTESP